jgi:hypothetical protein
MCGFSRIERASFSLDITLTLIFVSFSKTISDSFLYFWNLEMRNVFLWLLYYGIEMYSTWNRLKQPSRDIWISLVFHFLPESRTVKMDTGMNSPMRNTIVHEVETTVSNTKHDLVNSMVVLIDSRLNTFQSHNTTITERHFAFPDFKNRGRSHW